MKRWLWLLLVCTPFTVVHAQEFMRSRTWVHLNGYSHHFAAPDANSFLWGFGVTRYTRITGRMARSWEADAFLDSSSKPSGFLGHTWTVYNRHLAFGATGALMYHRNFSSHNGAGVMPVLLPFVESRGYGLKFRVYYVPPVRKASDHQLAVQAMLPWFGGGYARSVR